MADCPAAILAAMMREEQEKLLAVLAENVEALVGQSVEIKPFAPDSDEAAQAFGERRLYLFPVEDHESRPLRSLLIMDIPAAVHSGAAFSLMGPEQVKEVLEQGDIPEILHDSIGEVANILCGAAVNLLREKLGDSAEYRRAANFRVCEADAWPKVLGEMGERVPWDFVGGRMLIDGVEKGALLLAASDGQGGSIAADDVGVVAEAADASEDGEGGTSGADSEAEAEADQGAAGDAAAVGIAPGTRIHITCHPADPGARGLKTLLEESGARVLMATPSSSDVEVLFVISRSPTDMKIRLSSLASPQRRPPVVLACSDRPTRELVVAARGGGVDNFIVLPTTAEKIAALLAKVPAPA